MGLVSHISFTAVPAADVDRATGFDRDTLGLTVLTDAATPFMRRVMPRAPGADTLLHLDPDAKQAVDGPTPKPALVLVSADLDAAHDALVAAGAVVAAPPGPAERDGGMRRMMFKDGEGDLTLATSPLDPPQDGGA